MSKEDDKKRKLFGQFAWILNYQSQIGEQHIHVNGDGKSNFGKVENTEEEKPCEEEKDETGVRIKNALDVLQKEKLLKNLYDYTWVMEAMNQTAGMPNFDTPNSFITYLRGLNVERLPSEDTIQVKQNKFVGEFPNWEFTDCDITEATRRINVGKRFLNAYRSK